MEDHTQTIDPRSTAHYDTDSVSATHATQATVAATRTDVAAPQDLVTAPQDLVTSPHNPVTSPQAGHAFVAAPQVMQTSPSPSRNALEGV